MAGVPRSLVPGKLQSTFERELQWFLEERVVERLFDKDLSLWSEPDMDLGRIAANLAWLDLPGALFEYLSTIERSKAMVLDAGLDQWVLIAFDSASLACRALLAFPGPPPARGIEVLDTVQPAHLRRILAKLDPRRTFFSFASKTTFRLEDQSLFLYLTAYLEEHGIADSQLHFAAATERRSYLASLSAEYGFRIAIDNIPGIAQSFSSLPHIGGFLVVLFDRSPRQITEAAAETHSACASTSVPAENPALQLAAFLTSCALRHRSRLFFVASKGLFPYFWRLRQLIGGALAKGPHPLIPTAAAPDALPLGQEETSGYVFLTSSGTEDAALQDALATVRASGAPVLHLSYAEPLELLTDNYKWEIAVSLACARLGSDPFSYPNMRPCRIRGCNLLGDYSPSNNSLARTPRYSEPSIQAYVGSPTRHEISTLSLVEALDTFLRLRQPDSLLSLAIYVDQSPALKSAFLHIRDSLQSVLGLPVLMSYGPRTRECYGHLVGLSRPPILYLLITADLVDDIPIPGTQYTFGLLDHALALGCFDALVETGRHTLHLNLSGDLPAACDRLVAAFDQVVARSRHR